MISSKRRAVVFGMVCIVAATGEKRASAQQADSQTMQMLQQLQQENQTAKRITTDEALDQALNASSLTTNGKPFHAVLEIGKPGGEYSGRVEVWWQAPQMYKLQITSPKFSQTKIVNGDAVNEKDNGDYYPRWVENFVLAILNPSRMRRTFEGGEGWWSWAAVRCAVVPVGTISPAGSPTR